MHYATRLTVSAVAGAVALAGNQMYLAAKLHQEAFVAVARDVKPGDRLSESDLTSVVLGGDLARLRKFAIPWREKAILLEQELSRYLRSGDLVVRQDTNPGYSFPGLQKDEVAISISIRGVPIVPEFLRVNHWVHFVVAPNADASTPKVIQSLGPFKIAAVDQRVSPDQDELTSTTSSNGTILTLAVKSPLDKPTTQLIQAVQGENGMRIVSIVLSPDGT